MVLREMRENLGVALRRHCVPVAPQSVAQPPEVIDLAVEDYSDRPIFVGDRRIATHEVNDRQPVLADDAVAYVEIPLGIRTSVTLACQLQRDGASDVAGTRLNGAANAAHQRVTNRANTSRSQR